MAIRRSLLDRVLWAVGEDDPSLTASRVVAVQRFLLLAVTVEFWNLLPEWRTQPHYALHVAVAVVAGLCCVVGWFRRFGTVATGVMTVLMAIDHVTAFPRNANHQYLGMICMFLLLFLAAGPMAQQTLLLKALRWLAVIGLFYAGSQKLLYGHYFRGDFLAYAVARAHSFGEFFRYIIGTGEVERLRATPFGADTGPYLVDSTVFIAISNLTYLLEIVLPVLLFFRRVRPWVLGLTIAMIVGIELAARELFFGALMVNLLLLFARRDLNRPLLPLFVIIYLYALAMSVGLLPSWYFT